MTKLEFAVKLEKYQKRKRRSKWTFYSIAFVSLMFLVIPSSILNFNESESTFFMVMAVVYFLKASGITNGTEEQELLVNALDLLSAKNDT
ncbi:hypothetical protein HQQ94_11765 [Shewanella sp. VB17]|uniref:hypothetical protein n=1 Tax=Shewanella sp. VB17 TaxID=2739432 RepID=UPI0015635A2B|nr:hypothetical protein [Shewanella sp. VB17]NRD73898.1 hypothetical protein [Shewanella sp. VB17]